MTGPVAIGVDIGGTKIAAGVVAADGALLSRLDRPTAGDSPGQIERDVVDLVDRLRADHAAESVGIAAAGFVGTDRSTVLFAPNIAWRDHPLGQRLERGLGLPVRVENDANAAGWAEYRYGAAAGARNMVMLTIGTGVGGALIVNGELVRGGRGAAGEVGHIALVSGGRPCGCGGDGCWEQYASGRALTRNARAAATARPDRARALLDLAGGRIDHLDGTHVTRAAQADDPLAVELLADLGAWIAAGTATLTAILDPEIVVIGGGVGQAGPLLVGPIQAAFAAAWPGPAGRPPVVAAQLATTAGLVGVADLARTPAAARSHPQPDRPPTDSPVERSAALPLHH